MMKFFDKLKLLIRVGGVAISVSVGDLLGTRIGDIRHGSGNRETYMIGKIHAPNY